MMKIKRLVSVCTMTVMLACCGFSASARELFTDVPESEWAAPYIYNLADRGIIGGYGDGSFLPVERGSKMRICKNACQYYRDSDCSEFGIAVFRCSLRRVVLSLCKCVNGVYDRISGIGRNSVLFARPSRHREKMLPFRWSRLSDWTYQSTQTPTDFLPQGLGTGRTFHHLTARIYALRWITEL